MFTFLQRTKGIREDDAAKDPSQDTTAREQLGKHSESFKPVGIDGSLGSVRHCCRKDFKSGQKKK